MPSRLLVEAVKLANEKNNSENINEKNSTVSTTGMSHLEVSVGYSRGFSRSRMDFVARRKNRSTAIDYIILGKLSPRAQAVKDKLPLKTGSSKIPEPIILFKDKILEIIKTVPIRSDPSLYNERLREKDDEVLEDRDIFLELMIDWLREKGAKDKDLKKFIEGRNKFEDLYPKKIDRSALTKPGVTRS
eukprot:GHVN01099413.1.p1 GENE.GHVN01099413.1~~GHVN01099413.1.p1  ORF type:complete len:188 (+),score=5.47 GHVN01099413.1:156-719(+)